MVSQDTSLSYADHIAVVCTTFNTACIQHGLDVRLVQPSAEHSIKAKQSFENRRSEDGVLHRAQIETSVAIIKNLLTSDLPGGVAIGSMQSGKTSTAMACLFLTPISFLLEKTPVLPLFLTTSATSNETQFWEECSAFVAYYGSLNLKTSSGSKRSIVSSWTSTVSGGTSAKNSDARSMKDILVHRRVRGQAVNVIADRCKTLLARSIQPVLFLDESQYGASDRLTKSESGMTSQVPCVLRQIFDSVNEAVPVGSRIPFVCLSATPFESGTLSGLWHVGQSLDGNYKGINAFAGNAIDTDAKVTAPKVLNLNDLSSSSSGSDLIAFDPSAFKEAKTDGAAGHRLRFQMAKWLAHVIVKISQESLENSCTGICMRAINSNDETETLIKLMDLARHKIEVVKFYGPDARGKTVKQLLEKRRNPELPFVILVTNRARMSDSFPKEVRVFIEFSKKASDINALLQGLFGRACGYYKETTIYLSHRNKTLINDYIRNDGLVNYKPSRHAQLVSHEPDEFVSPVFEKFTPATGANDNSSAEFVARVQKDLIDCIAVQSADTLTKAFPIPATRRVANILKIAVEAGCLKPANDAGTIRPPETKFALRWSEAGAARAGAKAKTNEHEQSNQDQIQISLKKIDKPRGKTIADQHNASKTAGKWVITQIAIPRSLLETSGLKRMSGGNMVPKATFMPVPHSPFHKYA